MRKFLVLLLAVAFLASCGAVSKNGGFLTLKIDDPKAMVAVDDGKPVEFSKLEQPLDLMAIPHKIAVTWSQSGDTTTEFASVEYGKTTEFTPTPPKKETIEITSSIPGTVIAGRIELGHSSKLAKADVYAGMQTFEMSLDGFGYRWKTQAKVELGKSIRLEPGTDEKHGALYIKSESPGVNFEISGTDEKPLLDNGSLFIPNINSGKLEIIEKANPGVVHHVGIKAGSVTSLNFLTNFTKTSDKVTTLDTFGKTTLFVCWGTQTTEIDLTGVKSISEYELMKKTPFRTGTMTTSEVFGFLVCKDNEGFGTNTYAGSIPEKLQVIKLAEPMDKLQAFELAPAQNWSPKSEDGQWVTDKETIHGPGGYSFPLDGFETGCWDTVNYTVLTTKLFFDDKAFEVREAALSRKNPMVLGKITYDPIGEKNLDWINATAFYDADNLPMVVISSSKWTAIFKRTRQEDNSDQYFTLVKKLDLPSTSTTLYDRQYLVCRKTKSYFGRSFVIDLETKLVYDNMINPVILKNGFVANNFVPGANAGDVFSMESGDLLPRWAGLYY